MENLQEIPFKTYENQIFELLGEMSKVANLTKDEQRQYQRDLRWARDYNAVMEYAIEEGEAKGREQGLAEGRAEGLAEGRAEGLAEGRAEGERQKALTIARNLKKLGLSKKDIENATGLTEDEIINV